MKPKRSRSQSQLRSCELCNGEAAVYCEADAAFLCWLCDRRVHSANFLAARHIRRLAVDHQVILPGPGPGPTCNPDPVSSASYCVESGHPPERSAAAALRAMEAWGTSMGLRRWRRCARVAARVIGVITVLPQRVTMAAAMWFAVRMCDRQCKEKLRRLEICSGVPAKVIVLQEVRISRAVGMKLRRRRREEAEEGWGECE